jgi:hypothetical protein
VSRSIFSVSTLHVGFDTSTLAVVCAIIWAPTSPHTSAVLKHLFGDLILPCLAVPVQVPGRCIASANSPIDLVHRAVRQWLSLGIPPKKLLLGLPW